MFPVAASARCRFWDPARLTLIVLSAVSVENQDSMESMDELKRQALVLKSESGYGFCADVMRPSWNLCRRYWRRFSGAGEITRNGTHKVV